MPYKDGKVDMTGYGASTKTMKPVMKESYKNKLANMKAKKKKKAQTQPDNFTSYLNQTGQLPGGNTMGAKRVYGGIRL